MQRFSVTTLQRLIQQAENTISKAPTGNFGRDDASRIRVALSAVKSHDGTKPFNHKLGAVVFAPGEWAIHNAEEYRLGTNLFAALIGEPEFSTSQPAKPVTSPADAPYVPANGRVVSRFEQHIAKQMQKSNVKPSTEVPKAAGFNRGQSAPVKTAHFGAIPQAKAVGINGRSAAMNKYQAQIQRQLDAMKA